jgi:hypothetical protein
MTSRPKDCYDCSPQPNPLKGEIMTRLAIATLFIGVISSCTFALGESSAKQHLRVFRTERGAREQCPNDQIVWANTRLHVVYLPGDKHHGHTHGGFACESEARALGYRGPTSHA